MLFNVRSWRLSQKLLSIVSAFFWYKQLAPFVGNDTKSRGDFLTKFKGEFLYDYFPNCFSIMLSFEISHYTYRFLVLMKKTKKWWMINPQIDLLFSIYCGFIIYCDMIEFLNKANRTIEAKNKSQPHSDWNPILPVLIWKSTAASVGLSFIDCDVLAVKILAVHPFDLEENSKQIKRWLPEENTKRTEGWLSKHFNHSIKWNIPKHPFRVRQRKSFPLAWWKAWTEDN